MNLGTPQPVPEEDEKVSFRRVQHRDYQAHIDGLRCLAVVPVVLYHLVSKVCPGGFVGVDVFFVISGYLIYGGILHDLRHETFSLMSFYHRRIKRIFLAYFALVFATLLAGVALYHWGRLVPLAQTALFSAFFSTNIYFWLDMGYFQPNANENALLHLWTLGVEEQFYIVIPLLTLVLWKTGCRKLRPVLLFLLLASLCLSLALDRLNQSTTAFYILPTRSWELLAGALIADLPLAAKTTQASWLAFLGLVLILLPCWCFSTVHTLENGGTSVEVIVPLVGSLGIHPFPGLVIIPVVLGSLCLLRYGAVGPVAQLLTSLPFVGTGLISYSLYLWHWPLFVFARYIEYNHQTKGVLAFLFVLSFILAYFSWKWIETPFRINKRLTPKRCFVTLGLGFTLIATACTLLISTQGLRFLVHKRANYLASAPRPFSENLEKFVRWTPFRPPVYPLLDTNYFQVIGRPGLRPTFCIFGDSHAQALAPGLNLVASEYGHAGLWITKRIHPYVNETSQEVPQQLMVWVAANPDIRDIYMVGRWLKEYNISDGIPNLGDKGTIRPTILNGEKMNVIEGNFRHTANWFIQHGKHVYIFTDVPDYGYGPADLMARSRIIPLPFPIDVTQQDYLNRQLPITEILKKLQNKGLIKVIPLGLGFLSGGHTVFMGPDDRPYYQDFDHLTPEGALHGCTVIAPDLWPAAAKPAPAR